jgi:cellulose biosynthesis protein BcsQ
VIITVYSFKGGVGKTPISINLALHFGYSIVTNDVYTPLEKIFPKKNLLKLMPKDRLPEFGKVNVVIDLAGSMESRSVIALKQSDVVIVPVICDRDVLDMTLNFIKEIEPFNKNIIIIMTRSIGSKEEKDLEYVSNVIGQFYDYPIFPLRKSTAFDHVKKHKKSIQKIVEEDKILARPFKKINEQMNKIIAHLIDIKQ